jgi:hypothetical protein
MAPHTGKLDCNSSQFSQHCKKKRHKLKLEECVGEKLVVDEFLHVTGQTELLRLPVTVADGNVLSCTNNPVSVVKKHGSSTQLTQDRAIWAQFTSLQRSFLHPLHSVVSTWKSRESAGGLFEDVLGKFGTPGGPDKFGPNYTPRFPHLNYYYSKN